MEQYTDDYTDTHVKLTKENPRCEDEKCQFPPCVQQRRDEHVHFVLTRCGEQGLRGVLDYKMNCLHYAA